MESITLKMPSSRYNADVSNATIRNCFREPVPEIADAARYLDAAVSAHLIGRQDLAAQLIRLADIPAIRDWTESIWGKNSPYVRHRPLSPLNEVAGNQRVATRMPTAAAKRQLHLRDGYYCRFCGIPVIRAEVRKRIRHFYPQAVRWGKTNTEQHTAFQAMWAEYDHLLPHAQGGANDLANIVITCAPCNFGRMNYSLADVGLADPRERSPVPGSWDGLERFH